MAGFSKTQLLPTLHVYVIICRLCQMSSGTELPAVVFGPHVCPLFTLLGYIFLYNHRSNERCERPKVAAPKISVFFLQRFIGKGAIVESKNTLPC
jgi:hypothetical protein